MSFPYSTIFQAIGAIGRYALRSAAGSYGYLENTTLPADLQAIISQFGAGSTTYGVAGSPIDGIDQSYAQYQLQAASFRSQLAQYCQNVLTSYDYTTQYFTQPPVSNDINSVLAALQQQMVDDTQSIKQSVVTLGSVTAAAKNTGNGTAVIDAILDGYNRPLANKGFASTLYDGRASELCVPSETMMLTCTADSFSGNAQPGAEQWSLVGGPVPPSDWHWFPEGSGQGPSIQTAQGDTTLQNMDFDRWSGGQLSSWTATKPAQFTQETVNTYGAGSALRIQGDGVTSTLAISQPVPVSRLRARQRVCFTVRMMRSPTGGTAGTAAINILLTGTGYTDGAQIVVENVPTTYTLYSFSVNLPAVIPSDLALTIQAVNTLPATCVVYLDAGSFHPVNYFGGMNVSSVVRGIVPWVKGDRLSWSVANNQAGNFSTLFRRGFGVQLPSLPTTSQGMFLLLPFLLMPESQTYTLNDNWCL